jgi:ADP-ribose pyrophosphatase YjhB (NUDIX family)
VNNDPKHIEVLVRGLWVQQDKLLVCRNHKHGHCYLPGGHVEPGEHAKDALVREFQEETGTSVAVGAMLLVSEQVFEQRGSRKHEVSIVFHVEPASGEVGEVVSREVAIGFEWLEAGGLEQARFLPLNMIHAVQAIVERGEHAKAPPPSQVTHAPTACWCD